MQEDLSVEKTEPDKSMEHIKVLAKQLHNNVCTTLIFWVGKFLGFEDFSILYLDSILRIIVNFELFPLYDTVYS